MFPEIIDKFTDIDGQKLRYWQVGPQDGDLVLLIHGMGAASDVWGFLAADLAQEQYRVIALDLPGFGKSVAKGDISVPKGYISLIDEFRKKMGGKKVVVVGHSMGGIMAAGYANRFPENVAKLVLIASGGFGKIFPLYKFTASPLSEKLLLPLVGSRLIGPFVFRFFYGLRLPRKIIQELISHWRDYPLSKNFTRMVKALEDWKVFTRLLNIKSPILVLWGTWDYIVPLDQGKAVLKLLPHAQLELIKNALHCPHIANPQKVNPIIIDFLKA